MRITTALLTMLLCIGWQISLHGQTTVDIIGTVKSPQGALQGADVTFVSVGDEFLGNCVSGPDGRFKSQYKVQVGKTIKIRITSREYDLYEKTFTVDKTGNSGEYMLKMKTLTISGFVRDSVSDAALSGVEVFFYEESKAVQTRSTNSLGYFDIETNFRYGQKITVRVSKSGYYDKEQTLTFTSDGRNTLQDIYLPQLGDRGLRAYIKVIDKKKGKPLAGATVRYLDIKKGSHKDTTVSTDGRVELKIYQRPGTKLDLEISRPNYRTIKVLQSLNEDLLNNSFIYELEKDRRSSLGPALLIGGSTAALVSAGMYLSANSKYKSYKDFSNLNREDDYTIAENRRSMAVVGGAVAAATLAVYIIYRINQKNKEKDIEQKKIRTGFIKHFIPLKPSYASNHIAILGIAYQF